MSTPKHPDIAALIAAAATMTSIGEPISMAVKETIGRAECARLGRNPDGQVNWSGHEGGTTAPYWMQVADDAIISHSAAEQTRRNLLVPAEIHHRLEAIERYLGLADAGPVENMIGYKNGWQEVADLLVGCAIPAGTSPREVHEKFVMPRLRELIAGAPN